MRLGGFVFVSFLYFFAGILVLCWHNLVIWSMSLFLTCPRLDIWSPPAMSMTKFIISFGVRALLLQTVKTSFFYNCLIVLNQTLHLNETECRVLNQTLHLNETEYRVLNQTLHLNDRMSRSQPNITPK
jgi:hypothetical protein